MNHIMKMNFSCSGCEYKSDKKENVIRHVHKKNKCCENPRVIKNDVKIICEICKKDILKSFKKIYSEDFQKKLQNVSNPYDNGLPSKKIIKVLKNLKLQNILKKTFFQINFD